MSVALEDVLRSSKHKEAVVNAFNGSAINLLIIEGDDRKYSQKSLFDLFNSLLSWSIVVLVNIQSKFLDHIKEKKR